MPLGDTFLILEDVSGIKNIVLDRMSLEAEGVTPDTPVTIHASNEPFASALRRMLNGLNLTTVVRDDALVVTSQLQAGNELEHRVYPAADVLGDSPTADELLQIIERVISPNSWSAVGGAGTTQFFPPKDYVVINQTEAVHAQIEQLFASLRRGSDPPETEVQREIQLALAKRITFDFQNLRLDQAMLRLQELAGLKKLVLDRVALEEEGVTPGTPVTLRVRDMALRSVLRHLLEPLNLTMLVRDDAIEVTSELQAGNEFDDRIYPVAHLVGDPPDPDELIELIERMVSPNSWSRVGGAGTIEFFTPRRLLVVSQTAAVHSELSQLLAQLRGRTLPTAPAEQAVLTGLRTIFDWSFGPGPLGQLADRLAEGLNCTVVLDRADMEASGLTLTEPVTIEARNEPLESALRRGLEPIGVSFEVRDQALVLSNTRPPTSRQFVRTYPVATLVHSEEDADDLIYLLLKSVDEDSWDAEGGESAAAYFPPTRLLVVRQTEPGHDHVKALLAKLSAAQDNRVR